MPAGQVWFAPAGVRIRQWPARLASQGLADRDAGGLLRLDGGRVAGRTRSGRRSSSMAEFVGSTACPGALAACHGVHRPPVPRAGRPPGQTVQEGSSMTEAQEPGWLAALAAGGVGHASIGRPDPSTPGVVRERGSRCEGRSPARSVRRRAATGQSRWPLADANAGRREPDLAGQRQVSECVKGHHTNGRRGGTMGKRLGLLGAVIAVMALVVGAVSPALGSSSQGSASTSSATPTSSRRSV
jgi:hypothetical protein